MTTDPSLTLRVTMRRVRSPALIAGCSFTVWLPSALFSQLIEAGFHPRSAQFGMKDFEESDHALGFGLVVHPQV